MEHDDTVESCTGVYVRNIPASVNPDVLEWYFRSRLNPPVCEVKTFARRRWKQGRAHAVIDLGSYEKAQEALRKINGIKINGYPIRVSLDLKSFGGGPDEEVYLKSIPTSVGKLELYDLLSKDGTIIRLDFHYPRNKQGKFGRRRRPAEDGGVEENRRIRSASALFATLEQAQSAIQSINAAYADEQGVTAELGGGHERRGGRRARKMKPNQEEYREDPTVTQTSGEREGSTEPGSVQVDGEHATGLSSAEPSEPAMVHTVATKSIPRVPVAVRELLFTQYKDYIQPRERLRRILTILTDSLDLDHITTHCTKKERFDLYVQMIDSLPKSATTSRVRKGKSKWRRRRVKIPQLSDAALDLADEMQLTSMAVGKQLQVIKEKLSDMGALLFGRDELDHILDVMVETFDVIDLLEQAANVKEFHRTGAFLSWAIAKELEIDARMLNRWFKGFLSTVEPNEMQTTENLEMAIREQLLGTYQAEYGPMRGEELWDTIFRSLSLPDDVHKLLDACADPVAARLLAFYAQVAIVNDTNVVVPDLPRGSGWRLVRLDIDKLESMEEWVRVLREYVVDRYGYQYTPERLEQILDNVSDPMDSPSDLYQFLTICTSRPQAFFLYAKVSEIAIDNEKPFVYRDFSTFPVGVYYRLGLHKSDNKEEWKQVVLKRLVRMHGEQYGGERVETIVNDLFDSMDEPGTLYGLLELCADAKKFQEKYPL